MPESNQVNAAPADNQNVLDSDFMNMIGEAGANLKNEEFKDVDADLGFSAFEQ